MSWRGALAAAIGGRVVAAEPVAGGDINDAYRVQLADGRVVFVKTHAAPPPGMFEAEAAGLAWLCEAFPPAAPALAIPEVVAVGAHFLALAWLELEPRGRATGFDVALGRGLATLHRAGAPRFGFDGPSFLATLPQDNAADADGVTFWIERRVRPLVRRATALGHAPALDRQLDALRARPERFGPVEPPARLHGDLWWGNVGSCRGQPVIFDPAVYGGHREVDLAMLALFGGLPATVVDAYTEIAPLADGWRARVPLWQLTPLAAHAVLFGGSYGAQVARVLDGLL